MPLREALGKSSLTTRLGEEHAIEAPVDGLGRKRFGFGGCGSAACKMSEATGRILIAPGAGVFDVKRNSLRPAGDVCAGIALTSRASESSGARIKTFLATARFSQRDATQRR